MDKLIIYLICINILGAVLDGVTAARRRRTSHKALSVLLGIIAIAGGAPGMIIAFALCDRTASKTNMMLRVFTVCVCVIELTGIVQFCEYAWAEWLHKIKKNTLSTKFDKMCYHKSIKFVLT